MIQSFLMAKEFEPVLSLDLDGVEINPQTTIELGASKRFLLHLPNFLLRKNNLYHPFRSLPSYIERAATNEPITNLGEKISFSLHKRRNVFKGIKEALDQVQTELVFGNTGRVNKTDWRRMTRDTLSAGGVLSKHKSIIFKPKDVSSTISKGVALRDWSMLHSRVRHVDNNPEVLRLAPLLPEVEFVILLYWNTLFLLLGTDLSQYKNVKIARSFSETVKGF